MNDNLINYPLPIISVNKDGIVTGKNHSIEEAFKVVHVGSLVKRYTSIDFTAEKFSSGIFCDTECYYCTIFDNDETLLILALDTVSVHSLPFNIINVYKEKVKKVCEHHSEENKSVARKYVKRINDNLIKANYFNVYREIFNRRLQKNESDERVILSKIFTAIKTVTANNFEDASINFDIDYFSGNMVANVGEHAIIGLLLNTFSFCVINAIGDVDVSLEGYGEFAKIQFSFTSRASFDKWLNPDNDALLNSSLSLLIAIELSKNLGYEYSITKSSAKNVSKYTLVYKVPIKISTELIFSSTDTAISVAKRIYSLIFFDSIT